MIDGSTDSLKDMTMLGSENEHGIIHYLIDYLLQNNVQLRLSAFTIYREDINDLFVVIFVISPSLSTSLSFNQYINNLLFS